MENSLLLLSICDNIMVLKIFYFIRILIDIVCFVVPIGLIVIISIDFLKNVISGKDDAMKKNLNLVIKRLINAVVLFLVPVIVELVINGIGAFNVNYKDCFNITEEKIEEKTTEQKAKCTGNKYWSEVNFQCEEKEEYKNPNVVADDIPKKTYVSNSSSSSSSDTSSGNPNGGIGGKKELIYYNQGDPKYAGHKFCKSSNLQGSGCGAMSLAMMTSTFIDKKYDPIYVADWLCNNGHDGGGMSRNLMTKDNLLNHFNLNLEILFERDSSLNKEDAGTKFNKKEGNKILKAVKEGKGIILYIPGHYVAVGPNGKCDNDEVFLYDPGKRANNGCYTPHNLFNLTFNYKNRCYSEHGTKLGNCGWKSAYVYSKKK